MIRRFSLMAFTFWRRILPALAGILCVTGVFGASDGGTPPANVDALLQGVAERAKIPGMVAVVLRGDRIVAQGAAGVRRKGGAERVTLDDQFQIGSCTKAMTATLAAMLIEQGKLDWDSTLGGLFGDVVAEMDPAWRTVSLRQVMAHRAGLTDHSLLMVRSFLLAKGVFVEQRRRYVASMLSKAPDYAPGSRFVYSSSDYVLLGSALEKVTGIPWEALMRERLFRPLGMASAGFGPPGIAGAVDEPWGHGPRRLLYLFMPGDDDVAFDPGRKDADYPLVYGPAGSVHVSVIDWAKFVSFQLLGDPSNPHRRTSLLSADSFAKLHLPAPGESYCGGWFIDRKPWARGPRQGDTGRVFYHQGDNGRWNCVTWVAPEIDFAVLVACNRARMWGPVDNAASELVHAYSRDKGPGPGG
jgi:CubicO group peptidase (beta-lactamase class C family)